MGLWLKCPVCQSKNPLNGKACISCGASLVNLPPEQRVYFLGTGISLPAEAPEPPTVPAMAVAPSTPAQVPAKPATGKQGKGAKRPRKKKS